MTTLKTIQALKAEIEALQKKLQREADKTGDNTLHWFQYSSMATGVEQALQIVDRYEHTAQASEL